MKDKVFYTYILKNSLSGRHYIGSTNDVSRRLSEHNRGQTRSTTQAGEWKLIYVESFLSNQEAKKREQVVKSYKGGNAFKKLVTIVQR